MTPTATGLSSLRAGAITSSATSTSLIARAELSRRKGKVITPVNSFALVEDVVESSGGLLRYTARRAPHVVRKMEKNNAVLGSEENGGLVFPELQMCKNRIMTSAKMLECVVKDGLLTEQIEAFDRDDDIERNVPCPDGMKLELPDYFTDGMGGRRSETVDGLKIYFDDTDGSSSKS